jgi:CheY-like chemotaxis protein
MKKQKIMWVSWLLLLMFAGLFPPWLFTVDRSGSGNRTRAEKNAGYHFILTPPQPERTYQGYGIRLDTSRLAIEWVSISALVCALCLLAKLTKGSGLAVDNKTSGMISESPNENCKSSASQNTVGFPERIIMVHNEPFPMDTLRILFQRWFPDADVLLFRDTKEAWHEISLQKPDLLITGTRLPGLGGEDIVERLAVKKVKFPIIVLSAFDRDIGWIQKHASQGLNVSNIQMPFDIDTMRKALEAGLKVRLP